LLGVPAVCLCWGKAIEGCLGVHGRVCLLPLLRAICRRPLFEGSLGLERLLLLHGWGRCTRGGACAWCLCLMGVEALPVCLCRTVLCVLGLAEAWGWCLGALRLLLCWAWYCAVLSCIPWLLCFLHPTSLLCSCCCC
jgi:hypothetical protein